MTKTQRLDQIAKAAARFLAADCVNSLPMDRERARAVDGIRERALDRLIALLDKSGHSARYTNADGTLRV